jgi:hypothetical protein
LQLYRFGKSITYNSIIYILLICYWSKGRTGRTFFRNVLELNLKFKESGDQIEVVAINEYVQLIYDTLR